MSLTPTIEAQFLDYWFRGASTVPRVGTAGGTNYMNVCTASPGESGSPSLNEIYSSRQGISSWGSPYFDAVTNRPTIATTIEYQRPPGPSGLATHWLLSDSSTTGSTHRFFDTLASPVNIGVADTLRFRTGRIKVTLSGLYAMTPLPTFGEPSYRALENLVDGLSRADQTSTYYGLSTTTPNPDGTNVTEPTVGAYSRVFSPTTSTFLNPTTGASPTLLANSAAIVWPEATASWGTVTHWVCYLTNIGGDLAFYGAIDNPAEVVNGLQPRFDVGDLVLSCD